MKGLLVSEKFSWLTLLGGNENIEFADEGKGRNIELRDELIALRDTTAQSNAHAEHLKQRWAEIEKAQANFYQVSHRTRLSDTRCG